MWAARRQAKGTASSSLTHAALFGAESDRGLVPQADLPGMLAMQTSGCPAPGGRTSAFPRLRLTGKGRLYLALRRLDLDAVPDELAGRLADVVNTIAREHSPRRRPRVPLVGRITA